MRFRQFPLAVLVSVAVVVVACAPAGEQQTGAVLSVDYEKYTLDNGLDVVFHIDRSDPVVAVAMTYHVGSARELPGKTGFAHLFEHLLFLDSENVGTGGLDILMNKVGGSLNGSTNRDRTNYYQVVPNDSLEKVLWAEADKLGFFINTLTEPVVAKEKQVVKNEQRQGVDNQPYGHTSYVIGQNLYPDSHPYQWQVIGSLEDLESATLQDVRDFYHTWYGPDNATLVIAGDFDVDQAKAWVEKYFGEIAPVDPAPTAELEPVVLDQTKLLYHEDNFARLPALTMAWPTVPQYHPDSYPLATLASLLSAGKRAPLYKVLVEENRLAPNVRLSSRTSELAGELSLSVRAFADTDLDDVYAGVQEAFDLFEVEGFTDADLDGVKARRETAFYNRIDNVLGKAFQLAQYNIFAGSPGYIEEDIAQTLAVSREDVMRVYDQYLKDRHFVATSFVPKGKTDLIVSASVAAEIVEEPIVAGAEQGFVLADRGEIEKTPSSIDRSVEPPFGDPPSMALPEIWTEEMANGMTVYGIQNTELPLVQLSIRLKGGLLLDDPDKVGVASLMASLMNEGTATKTAADLEAAIDELGASISVRAGRETFSITVNTLSRNYDQTMALVEEMLLEPRWDESEFELAKNRTVNALRQQQASPNAIAANAYNTLIYGREHILSNNLSGTPSSVEAIAIDDLKMLYERAWSPSIASVHVVGDISADRVLQSLAGLAERWQPREVEFPHYDLPDPIEGSRVFFVDIPDAKQSVIRVGYLALAQTDADYYPATVMNYRLGGGGFASQILQTLREQKGYTYGAGSSFSGTELPGPFTVATSVRSNATYDSVRLIKEILENYEDGFDEIDLAATKGFLVKSNARAFETLGAKLRMLQNISAYDLPHDYVLQREEIVRNMTMEQIKELADRYVDAERIFYLVVGDAATQLDELADIGFGVPVLLDADANPVQPPARR